MIFFVEFALIYETPEFNIHLVLVLALKLTPIAITLALEIHLTTAF